VASKQTKIWNMEACDIWNGWKGEKRDGETAHVRASEQAKACLYNGQSGGNIYLKKYRASHTDISKKKRS